MKLITSSWMAVAVVAMSASGLAVLPTAPTAMTAAATRYLESLTPEQRAQSAFPFEADERMRWHFIPTESFPRKGLTIKEMSAEQRTRAHDLLKTGLSQRGYMTATQIMELERVLAALEAAQRAAAQPPRIGGLSRDPERYFFSVFGTPTPRGTWGWRAEGHHLSLHFTIVNGTLLTGSPAFFGTNPAEVREGEQKGLRILGAREDAARALIDALESRQRTAAVIDTTAPNDMVTMNTLKIEPMTPAGIPASALTAPQRTLLTQLVDVYIGAMTDDIAIDRRARIEKAGWDKVTFAWAGSLLRGQRHYYRVQGPTFLIEYDNTQNNANHIHSVWRDFAGDFGADLLREHVRNTPH